MARLTKSIMSLKISSFEPYNFIALYYDKFSYDEVKTEYLKILKNTYDTQTIYRSNYRKFSL